jgi:tetratricopeptide (TPR) repeat protein
VLTAAHVVEDATAVQVRFDADLAGEWTAKVISHWVDRESDVAVLTIAPREAEPPTVVARFGQISADQAAVLTTRAVGFPRFKLKDGQNWVYRDSHQADGSAAVLSNRREGTLEVTVSPPERDPDPTVSPWESMSGAAVWVADRIVGVVIKHHRSDGLGRLAAARVDLALAKLSPDRQAELRALLDMPEVLSDVIPRSPSEWVRSAYQAQVRDIAPQRLADRDAELAELVGFCAGDQPYAWWQAGPWAGKSALMAWFVLHPPAGVDVVSFFVTARLAGQSDSNACTAALIEQLAALVHELPANVLATGALRGTMWQLLEDAASRALESGRRLLLVIDGLDEDSGPAGSSIAALLPRRPPAGVRILVAGRPNPTLPDDVHDDHPLRRLHPRQLDVSEHAKAVEHRAKNELKHLLGDPLHRDVLGFITAAGGGLTAGDLARLTGRQSVEIEEVLGGAFSRSVDSRTETLSAGYPDERVYLFAHETLRLAAEQRYGTAGLATYRDRIHEWAESYRQLGWPADTPIYLLRSYSLMLAGVEDVSRLAACGTDRARHDRMRSVTGGDALALTEISTAQQHMLAQPSADLTSLVLLAVQRDQITDRNYYIPPELPAVWARIGQVTRAEGLLGSVTTWQTRRDALRGLVVAVAARGDHDRVARLIDDAEAHISEAYPIAHISALAELIKALATAEGDHHDQVVRLAQKADGLIEQVTAPERRGQALALLVPAVAVCGHHDRAEALAGQVTDPSLRASVLSDLARLLAADGAHAQAARLADEAEAVIGQIVDPGDRNWRLGTLVRAVAALGDYDRAEALAGQTNMEYSRATALAEIARVVAAEGRLPALAARLIADAEVLAEQITLASTQISALTTIVPVVAASGDLARAIQLADKVHALIAQGEDLDVSDELAGLAEAVAAAGDHERAERLIREIADPHEQMLQMAQLAEAVAIAGDDLGAARLADEVEFGWEQVADPHERMQALTRLTQAAAVMGDDAQAARLLVATETMVWQIAHLESQQQALVTLMETTNVIGDYQRTRRLASAVETQTAQDFSTDGRATAVARLAEVLATAGDHAGAARLITEIEQQIEQLDFPDQRANATAALARATAAAGDHARAAVLVNETEALIGQTTFPESREEGFARLARAVAAVGDHQWAEALVRQITDADVRAGVLIELAQGAFANGDRPRAARLTAEAETFIWQISDRIGALGTAYRQAGGLAKLMVAVAEGGDHDRVARLAGQAETLARQVTPQPEWTMAVVAKAVAESGDHERATRLVDEVEILAEQITNSFFSPKDGIWLSLVDALAICGDHARAEALAGQIADPGWRVGALAGLLRAAIQDGDHDRAGRLADEAEAFLGQIRAQDHRLTSMAQLVKVVAAAGDEQDRAARITAQVAVLIGQITYVESQLMAWAQLADAVGNHQVAEFADKAEALVGQSTDEQSQVEALALLAQTLSRADDHDRAARLIAAAAVIAEQPIDAEFQAKPVTLLVEAVALMGDHALAARMAREAEALLNRITHSDSREQAVVQLVGMVADTRDFGRAEALTAQITNPHEHVRALARLAETVATQGDHALAGRLADEAETLAERMDDGLRVEVLAGLAGSVVVGDPARTARLIAEAEVIIGQITEPDLQSIAMVQLAEALVKTGESPVPGLGSSVLMRRCRHLLAGALVTGSWSGVVATLARVDPPAVTALIGEIQARWQLDTSVTPEQPETPAEPEAAPESPPRSPQWKHKVRRWLGGRG